MAGAVVQWLRDGLGLIEASADVERLAATVEDNAGVVVVPAFVGLGAPHWDPYARGSIFGITRGTTSGHLARAAVESIAFQSCDLLSAMQADSGITVAELKVDGGASVNRALMQFQADLLGVTVRRPEVAETNRAWEPLTWQAWLTGSGTDQNDVAQNWAEAERFHPTMDEASRTRLTRRWHQAVQRTLQWDNQEAGE